METVETHVDCEAAADWFDAKRRQVMLRIDGAFADTLRDAYNFMRGNTGFHSRTGKLSASMFWQHIPGTGTSKGWLGAKASYALWVEESTKPHWITGKNGGLLHFYSAKAGNWITCRKVWHPGTTGRQFVERAAYRADMWLPNRCAEAVEKALS